MLEVKNVKVSYGDYIAVDCVSLSVEGCEIIGIAGANGMGKSSLMKAIIGLNNVTSGVIKFNGEEIQDLKPYERVRKGISIVPEGRELFYYLTVEENLDIGAYSPEARKRAKDTKEVVFNFFPILRERRKQLAGTLSGGEQQMLAIGRALMTSPKLCLMDEISLGLAPIFVDKIYEIIPRLRDEGITILISDQFLLRVIKIVDRLYVMERGKIVWEGAQDQVNIHILRKKYFGAV